MPGVVIPHFREVQIAAARRALICINLFGPTRATIAEHGLLKDVGSVRWSCSMGHLDTCLGMLQRSIAKGGPNGIPLAERAIHEYLEVTPVHQARKSSLLYLQQERNAVLGNQRSFAGAVNAYIEKKLETQ